MTAAGATAPGAVTPPGITLFLTIPAEQALHRKQAFSSLETGHTGTTPEAFTAYQDSVAAQLRKLAARQAWVTIDVAGKPAEAVLEEALTALTPHTGLTRMARAGHADAREPRTQCRQ
jgi:thymidylate kinase